MWNLWFSCIIRPFGICIHGRRHGYVCMCVGRQGIKPPDTTEKCCGVTSPGRNHSVFVFADNGGVKQE